LSGIIAKLDDLYGLGFVDLLNFFDTVREK
jgi:hypothetical protein